ncbi:MAG TPA: TOBE domain-containing protein, partial [Chloroflexota bacterium]
EVAEFFGSMNWLAGHVSQPCVADTEIGPVRLPDGAVSGKVRLGFRPEALSPANGAATRADNVVEGRLLASTFLGDQFLFRVQVRGQVLLGKSRLQPKEQEGCIRLGVDPADIMIFPEG